MTNLDSVFRREWGPAVAALARWSGDLTVAEDAVQEAFADALRTWPRDGVPANPGAWIVTTARNRAIDRLRREAKRPALERLAVTDPVEDDDDVSTIPDERLALLFTCCHPALATDAQV